MTATQISKHVDLPILTHANKGRGGNTRYGDLDAIGYVLWELSVYGLVVCLSPKVRRSRVYGCTSMGIEFREKLATHREKNILSYCEPNIDWAVYAWVCYTHRSTIIKVLQRPLYPSAIKRRILIEYPNIKISSNNVRDAIRLLKQKEIVEPVVQRKRAYPLYRLTKLGEHFRALLLKADFCG